MRFASTLISCLPLMCSVVVAHAEKRVALVIGNGAYQNAPAPVNPRNDAQDIDKSLRDLGFATIVATDLDRAGMNDALDRFSRMVGGAEIALVYYSGHGMQFAGKNFLLPVEARLESADDVNRFRLMPLEDVFDLLQGVPGPRIVILDACRNNPVEHAVSSKPDAFGVSPRCLGPRCHGSANSGSAYDLSEIVADRAGTLDWSAELWDRPAHAPFVTCLATPPRPVFYSWAP